MLPMPFSRFWHCAIQDSALQFYYSKAPVTSVICGGFLVTVGHTTQFCSVFPSVENNSNWREPWPYRGELRRHGAKTTFTVAKPLNPVVPG